MAERDFEIRSEVVKVDASLGLVMGFAVVCTEDGEPYFDLQGDHIPDDSMLKAATDFMLDSRESHVMHDGEEDGSVVFAFPLTADVAKAFNILTHRTGLMIAMKPSSDVLKRYQLGELTGFSIGGSRIKDEEVD